MNLTLAQCSWCIGRWVCAQPYVFTRFSAENDRSGNALHGSHFWLELRFLGLVNVIHGLSKIQSKLNVLVWFWSMQCSDLLIVSLVHRLQLGHRLLCRVTVCYYAGPDRLRPIFRWVARVFQLPAGTKWHSPPKKRTRRSLLFWLIY
jgi:hypothetical protein